MCWEGFVVNYLTSYVVSDSDSVPVLGYKEASAPAMRMNLRVPAAGRDCDFRRIYCSMISLRFERDTASSFERLPRARGDKSRVRNVTAVSVLNLL